MQTTRFASRKGTFLRIALATSFLLPLLLIVLNTEIMLAKPVVIVMLFLPLAFFAWIYFDTSYTIAGDTLLYKSGFLRGRIDIARIKHLVKGHTAWSGVRPATALKGLLVVVDGGTEVYISPERQDEFIDQIRRLNSKVVVKGID